MQSPQQLKYSDIFYSWFAGYYVSGSEPSKSSGTWLPIPRKQNSNAHALSISDLPRATKN
jgi:hypothetical protein